MTAPGARAARCRRTRVTFTSFTSPVPKSPRLTLRLRRGIMWCRCPVPPAAAIPVNVPPVPLAGLPGCSPRTCCRRHDWAKTYFNEMHTLIDDSSFVVLLVIPLLLIQMMLCLLRRLRDAYVEGSPATNASSTH